MYATVIFDLDGTLLDTIADLSAAAEAVCRDFGWPAHRQAEIQAMVGNGIPRLVARFAPAGTPEERLAEALARFQAHYRRCCTERTRPYPGIPAMLARLREAGARLGVLSNKADAFTRAMTAHYFPGVFDAVRGSAPAAPAKPGGAAARAMRQALGGGTAVLVGDSDVDLRTAENAGMDGCAVTWGFRSRAQLVAAGAARLAETPEALLAMLLSGGA